MSGQTFTATMAWITLAPINLGAYADAGYERYLWLERRAERKRKKNAIRIARRISR